MFILTDEQYQQGIELNEYNGVYSLISAKQGDNRVFQQWCRVEIRKGEYASKNIPMGVRLGPKDQAVKILRQLAEGIKAEMETTEAEKQYEYVPPGGEPGDIPF